MPRVFAFLALVVAACGGASPDASRPPSQADAGTEEFPSLAIFEASKWWTMVKPPSSGPRAMLEEIRKLEALQESDELGARQEALAWKLVPTLFAALRPLWDKEAWSADEVEAADAIAGHLAKSLGAPAVGFKVESPTENRRHLRTLARWFRERAAEPRTLGRMVFTMDFGPFEGIPLDEAVEFARRDDVAAGEFRVSLGECPHADGKAWALRCSKGERILWTRIVSQDEHPVRENVTLRGDAADDLGPYGWCVHMSVGGEHGHAYVDREGRLLFYFISW